jgi:aarF domain-containing kinase
MTSFSLLGGSGVTAYAHFVEYQAELSEEQHRLDHTVQAFTLPRKYDWDGLNNYWSARPVATAKRFGYIMYELVPLAGGYIKDFVVQKPADKETSDSLQLMHSERLREALTNLGPAFVKAGQQLSIRPDLVPPTVLKELQKLCDEVRPIPDEVALNLIREELGEQNLDVLFEDIHLVAAASLGQVYKAKLRKSGKEVAIKVQRPNMRQVFSLDLFLLQKIGVLVDVFTTTFTNQPPFHKALYESFSCGSYMELDYENEATNQMRFQKELAERKVPVVIPDVYQEFTTEKVLISQWIEGKKLADSPREEVRKLIPIGVELFLTQLLDIGAFHADPHGSNLLVVDGQLCLLDFGLCAEVDTKSRNAMTKAIVHLLTRDFESLVSEDAKEMGFLPQDFDTSELKPLLTKILTVGLMESGSDLRKRKRGLMEISNELNEVFFNFPFTVPPFLYVLYGSKGCACNEFYDDDDDTTTTDNN